MSPIPGHGGWAPRRSRAVVRKCGHRWCCSVRVGCWLCTHGQSSGCPAVFRKDPGSRRRGILLVGVPFCHWRTGPQGRVLMSVKFWKIILLAFDGYVGSLGHFMGAKANSSFCSWPCGLLCQGLSPSEEAWGLLASAWARQGETQKAAQWLRQVEGWDLVLKLILSGLLRFLGTCSRTSCFGCLQLASSDPSSWLLCFERLCEHSQATSPSSPLRADGRDADATLGGNHRCLCGGLFQERRPCDGRGSVLGLEMGQLRLFCPGKLKTGIGDKLNYLNVALRCSKAWVEGLRQHPQRSSPRMVGDARRCGCMNWISYLGLSSQDMYNTHTHTLAQTCHCELCCGMHLTCKHTPIQPGRSGPVNGPESMLELPYSQENK